MPTYYKCTMFFDYDEYGWSESIVMSFPAPLPLDQVIKWYLTQYGNARMLLLVPQATNTYIRIGVVGTNRAVQVFERNLPGRYEFTPGNVNLTNSLPPNVALLLRFYPLPSGPAKSTFLRGLPAEINMNGTYMPTANWTKIIGKLELNFHLPASQPMGWWGVQSSVSSPVTGYQQNANGQTTVTTKFPIFAGLPAGVKALVRFSGINGKSPLNGTQVCFGVDATDVITKDGFGLGPYVSGGKAELPTYGFTQATTLNDERLMSRKCGKALFLERGRAPVKARR